MANIMQEVASLLGVRLGERFRVRVDGEAVSDDSYVLRENGLFSWSEEQAFTSPLPFKCGLNQLLTGEAEIVKLPWRPKKGERYYILSNISGVWTTCHDTWLGDNVDISHFAMGNCFRTEEEVLANKDKTIKLYNDILEGITNEV